MTTPILEAKELTQKFGGLTAVDNVSLHVGVDELVALIGPNGAGKTTLFNMLTGVNAPTEGDVYLAGEKITGKKAYAVAQMGISRTFQNIRLFSDMTVLENVLTALTNHYKESFVSSVLRLPSYYKTEDAMKEEAMKLLNDFGLASVAENRAGNLPYGAQRRVEIVRALATRPKVIFLDEPAAGMNPEETADLTRLIKKIQSEYHTAVLLIEHDMSLVMNIAERIYVLDHGHLLAEGTPKEIQDNPEVIKAYLGGDADADA
ncbi:ABC transporter ATP-binding protein [Ligilactobacillus ruminis]|uniref:BC transporter, ATP-binding protein n=2 Tax=Ligilactobacillus ruminis TaxID=1623 RepID=A0A837IQ50_9LACO|nr:ABC transporter ATP-binding protein [Ligilactobacillus ruminis]KLA44601.1 BC transporter, ATP-binding protein [Ligilactobacillus ruminis]KRM81680.1 BC transporter, ATP-binding protein [Ligilactobacillus ruminis DSM 20403 = NBRC 102161]SFG50026.1 branched-chain amino acid transport system ATP-binding protein [Ligilactobacillus ruminis DSM 20403 = NBRC 102161]